MTVIQNSCAWMRTIRSSFQNSLREIHAAVLTLPPPRQVTRGALHTGTPPPPRRPGPANPRPEAPWQRKSPQPQVILQRPDRPAVKQPSGFCLLVKHQRFWQSLMIYWSIWLEFMIRFIILDQESFHFWFSFSLSLELLYFHIVENKCLFKLQSLKILALCFI